MSKPKVVIVYPPGLASCRTVVVPDEHDPDDWDQRCLPLHVKNIAPGEAVMVVSLGLYNLIGPDAIIEQITGRSKVNDRCALVDMRGIVIGYLCADTTIDRRHRSDGILQHDPNGLTVINQGYYHQKYVPPLTPP